MFHAADKLLWAFSNKSGPQQSHWILAIQLSGWNSTTEANGIQCVFDLQITNICQANKYLVNVAVELGLFMFYNGWEETHSII